MERTFWKVTRWARAGRFWLYLVFALLAFFGCNEARAGYCGVPYYHEADDLTAPGPFEYEGDARAACESSPSLAVWNQSGLNSRMTFSHCEPTGGVNKTFRAVYVGTNTNFGTACNIRDGGAAGPISTTGWPWSLPGCPPGYTWNEATKQCDPPPECSVDDPPLGPTIINTPTADAWQACSGGCSYIDMDGTSSCQRIDGSFWCSSEGWEATGLSCSPGTPETGQEPPTDSDGDGISDDNDSNPENPGETGDNDGEGDGDDTCGGEGQPACNNDGGTSGAGNTSVGGASCDSPPNSNGDAILAQIAFQTWATRCAVQGNANQGGGTGVIPGDGDGSREVLEDIRDWLDGDGQELDTPEDPWVEGEAVEPSDWSLGLGSTGTCPAPISETITIAGHSQDIELSFQPLCDFAGVLRTMMIALGALVAAYIIAGVRR